MINTAKSQIGFKVTDNKLMVLEDANQSKILDQLGGQDEAIFSLAIFIHELMLRRSKMLVNNEPFFEIEGKKIEDRLNKMYIRYYENF
jgi:hypothetical protein